MQHTLLMYIPQSTTNSRKHPAHKMCLKGVLVDLLALVNDPLHITAIHELQSEPNETSIFMPLNILAPNNVGVS